MLSNVHIRWSAIAACFTCSCLVGCHSFPNSPASSFPAITNDPAGVTAAPQAQVPTCIVEIRPDGGQMKQATVPLDHDVFIQDALTKAKASRKFSRFKIDLYRAGDDGTVHRIPIAFDRKTKSVPPGSDYALRPNDRLVVSEDSTNLLEEMLDSVTSPLAAFR